MPQNELAGGKWGFKKDLPVEYLASISSRVFLTTLDNRLLNALDTFPFSSNNLPTKGFFLSGLSSISDIDMNKNVPRARRDDGSDEVGYFLIPFLQRFFFMFPKLYAAELLSGGKG